MARKFQHKRGVKANLPKLSPAEMAFTTDEKKLYVGDGNENIRILDQKDKTELTTQLAEMSTKGYVNSLTATLASGSPKGVYSSLSDLQTAFPNGNTNIYLVNGHWYYWNSTKPNLFNKDTMTMGKFLINGVPSDSKETAGFSDFITVSPNQELWITRLVASDGGGFFDQDKNFISKIVGDGTNILKIPANVYYVRINISTDVSPLNTFMVLDNKATGFWKDGGVYQATELPDNVVTLSKIDATLFDKIDLVDKNNKIRPEHLFTSKTKNLFNKNAITVGYYLINGVPTASAGNMYSDYMRVTPGSTVYATRYLTSDAGSCYDRNLKFISKLSSDGTKIAIPSTAYYIRINISNGTNLNTFMVNEGASLLPHDAYGVGKIEGLVVDSSFTATGKKILAIGDSITWLDGQTVEGQGKLTGYQEQFRKLGASVTNKGNSGATYRKYDPSISDMSHGSIYDDIVTNNFDVGPYDIITLFGGTNDVGRGFNLGTVGNIDDSTFDPKTTLGSLRGIIEYIRSRKPDCEIYIITPIRSGLASRPYNKMEQLTEGIINVAKMYGIPFVDLLHEGGIGKGNYSVYLYDDLHPNNKGFEMIGKRITRYINAK